MAVGTIRALMQSGAESVVLWGPPRTGSLLRTLGIGNDLLPYARRSGLGGLADVWSGRKALAAQIASTAHNHEVGVLLMPNAFEPALIAWAAAAGRRVGYATEMRGGLLTDPIAVPPVSQPLHDADRYAALLGPLGVAPPGANDYRLQPPEHLLNAAAQRLSSAPNPIALIPGSANDPRRRWPIDRFAQLADLLAQRDGSTPVLLGSPAEVALTRAVAERATVTCLDLAGTDLHELTALLASCLAVVSNDTGPAHLAAALGRPTVVLYGPTDVRRTGVRGPATRRLVARSGSVLEHDVDSVVDALLSATREPESESTEVPPPS